MKEKYNHRIEEKFRYQNLNPNARNQANCTSTDFTKDIDPVYHTHTLIYQDYFTKVILMHTCMGMKVRYHIH